jgi:hypothetical protein
MGRVPTRWGRCSTLVYCNLQVPSIKQKTKRKKQIMIRSSTQEGTNGPIGREIRTNNLKLKNFTICSKTKGN